MTPDESADQDETAGDPPPAVQGKSTGTAVTAAASSVAGLLNTPADAVAFGYHGQG